MTRDTCVSPLATRALLYRDTIKGEPVCRYDMWAVSTDELNALHREIIALREAAHAPPPEAAQPAPMPVAWTPQAALTVLQMASDGAFGESAVQEAIEFLNCAERCCWP